MLLQPSGELGVCRVVKLLKAQVRQNMLAIFRIGRFTVWDFERQRGGEIKLRAQIMHNGRGEFMDLWEEATIASHRTELNGHKQAGAFPILPDLTSVTL